MPPYAPSSTPTASAKFTVDTITRFAIGVTAYNLVVIGWGAFVRATGSGAGCGSHWPLCNGAVIPRAPETETLIELTHRATSGLAALAVFALAWWVFRVRAPGHPARRVAVVSALLMVVEALLGAGLVLFGWVDDDASWGRVAALALHLVTTFLLLAALTLTTWRLAGGRGNRWLAEQVDGAVVLSTLALVAFVGMTGAITSLGDTLFPSASLTEGFAQDVSPTSHFLVRLRVVHPVIAVLTAIAVIRGTWLLSRRRPSPLTARLARIASGLIVAQLAIGALNLVLLAPVAMQLIHLLFADLVWMSLVLFGAAALAVRPGGDSAFRGADA